MGRQQANFGVLSKKELLAWVYSGLKNIYATYIELSEKGVNFLQEPQEIEFGLEALFEDNSGNWFSLMQVNNNENEL